MRHRVSSGGWYAALHPYPWLTGTALALAAALCGAALAGATRRPHARATTAIGLAVAAVGLAALDLAGLAAPSGRLLAVLRGSCSCARSLVRGPGPRCTPRW